MHAENVPVKFQGKVIGHATIHDDGRMAAEITAPAELGEELLFGITRGHYSAVTFDVERVPAVPRQGEKRKYSYPYTPPPFNDDRPVARALYENRLVHPFTD